MLIDTHTHYGFHPLKRFSQNFLKDRSIAERIVESLNIKKNDHILEIGSGEGALTEFLLKSSAERIVGVEIDRRLAEQLRKKFGGDNRFELIEKDFLNLDLESLIAGGEQLRIVGNLPYSITTPVLFAVLDHRSLVKDLTVMVQKEVGERITSPSGSKKYGIPSVLFQLSARIELLFPVHRGAFYPAPKVDSVVIQFRFFNQPRYKVADVDFFVSLVKTAFGQRRKMLKNTLKKIVIDEKILEQTSVNLHQRPEELSVAQFVQLSNELVKIV